MELDRPAGLHAWTDCSLAGGTRRGRRVAAARALDQPEAIRRSTADCFGCRCSHQHPGTRGRSVADLIGAGTRVGDGD
jgi:hypothetical protein